MAMVRTAKGKMLDMNQLRDSNSDVVAITGGGISMNARGDIIGSGGKILKRREDIEREEMAIYNDNAKNAVKKVSIKSKNIVADSLRFNDQTEQIIEPATKKEAKVDEPVEQETIEETAKSDKPKRKTTTDKE